VVCDTYLLCSPKPRLCKVALTIRTQTTTRFINVRISFTFKFLRVMLCTPSNTPTAQLRFTRQERFYEALVSKYPILLTDLNQIWTFSREFHKDPQYQISRKSVQWESRWCMRTDGHDKANRCFSRLCERVYESSGRFQILNCQYNNYYTNIDHSSCMTAVSYELMG